MSMWKRMAVACLLRLYPARWRREYGAELSGILISKKLGPRAVLDVVWSASGQQLRSGEPWLIVGVPLLLLNLVVLAGSIFNPWTLADTRSASLLQQSLFWLPVLVVGCWTVMRSRGQAGGGRAAVKTVLITSWPISAIALLAAMGLLRIVTSGAALSGAASEHGLAIVLYDSASRPVRLVPLFLLPLFNLPFAALGGWMGGLIGRLWLRMEKT